LTGEPAARPASSSDESLEIVRRAVERLEALFGIEPLVRGGSLPRAVVGRREKPMASANTFTLAPITFAMGLFVCTEVLGWPSRQSIHEVFESSA
jgi:hypothetical protein